MPEETEAPLRAEDLRMLAARAHTWTNISNNSERPIARAWWMRLIGEVWRLRAKVRYQAQRIRDMERGEAQAKQAQVPGTVNGLRAVLDAVHEATHCPDGQDIVQWVRAMHESANNLAASPMPGFGPHDEPLLDLVTAARVAGELAAGEP